MDPLTHTHSLYEAFGKGDLDTIFKALHPRIEWISNGDASRLPWGGKRNGLEGAKSFFASIKENIEFHAFEPREFFAGPDFVTVLGLTRGRMRTSGQDWESEWMHLFRYADGQLILFREFYDTHAMTRALRPGSAA